MKTEFRNFLKCSILALFCLVAAGNVYAQTEDSNDKVIRILAIGNSFSRDAVEQYLHELACEEGIPVVIGNMYIGGCSLQKHMTNAQKNKRAYQYRKIGVDGKMIEMNETSLETAIKDESWDFISFQQKSGLSGIYSSWEKYLPMLMDYVRALAPEKTRFVIHQTWAYAEDSDHSDFKNYSNDQIIMYNAIVDAVGKAAKLTKTKTVIPCGTAIQNARTTILKDMTTRDGYHLNLTVGRYIAACTWFEKIFGKNVIGKQFAPKGVTPEQRALAQKSAHAAIKRPNKISKIK
ncbi:MAG: DUF4886 domain-containing protein [Bacteroidales bacterium]|nr:DUF4886 domain-containing protein [Bacteroidales bacterium]